MRTIRTTVTITTYLLALLTSPLLSAAPPLYGQHFPHGWDAVNYLYGANGMWRDWTGMHYQWNFYSRCATADHPDDRQALLFYARTNNVTAPDANCLLLGDADNDGRITAEDPVGYAFHEHSGRGTNGERTAAPMHQYWLDDNWLARYIARAYEQPEPSGLHDNGYPIRWRQLGGDNANWTLYPSAEHIDQIALNGIYKLNAGDFDGALGEWNSVLTLSGWAYDSANQRFDYPGILEVYHLGLWTILSERLLAESPNFWNRSGVLQHAVSMRSHLLSLQERSPAGERLGWKTGIDDPVTLMNTETLSVAVLALGAGADWVFEPGHAPLGSSAGDYILRPNNVLSAIAGKSQPGYMVRGPNWTLAPGTYDIEFALRTPSNTSSGVLATLDVHDGASVLQTATVTASMMPANGEWMRHRLTVELMTASDNIEFRIYWPGLLDLDLGSVRVVAQ